MNKYPRVKNIMDTTYTHRNNEIGFFEQRFYVQKISWSEKSILWTEHDERILSSPETPYNSFSFYRQI